MKIPIIRGRIARRILVNYRVDPDVLRRLLPTPFRPVVVNGHGMAGICLIRLSQVCPRFLPGRWGITSENAAHRIAVEWTNRGESKTGVFIPRRDTSSRLNALIGGRLFPGVHQLARFQVRERPGRYSLVLTGSQLHVAVDAEETDQFPRGSAFGSLEAACRFFQSGSIGYSPARHGGAFDGLELRIQNWNMRTLKVHLVESSFFDDRSVFPSGVAEFDSAFLMRNIDHEWHGRCSLPPADRAGGIIGPSAGVVHQSGHVVVRSPSNSLNRGRIRC